MDAADLRARIRRLKQLQTGFKAEIVARAIDCSPMWPVEAQMYRDALAAIDQAMGTAIVALDAGLGRLSHKWKGGGA